MSGKTPYRIIRVAVADSEKGRHIRHVSQPSRRALDSEKFARIVRKSPIFLTEQGSPLFARGYLQVWAASFGTQVSFCPFELSCWQQPLAHWALVTQVWLFVINSAVHLPLTQVP